MYLSRLLSAHARRAGLAALALLVAACASPPAPAVVSRPDPVAPRVRSQRVFVISLLAKGDPLWAPPFATAIKRELAHAGAQAEVQSRDPLAVQSDRAAYAEQMKQFAPQGVLTVVPGDGTIDREGRNLSRRFEAALYRPGSEEGMRELVWRASVLVRPSGSYVRPADMDQLAAELVRKLRQDGYVGGRRHAAPVRAAGGSPVNGGYKQE